jgi:hypothetical protein
MCVSVFFRICFYKQNHYIQGYAFANLEVIAKLHSPGNVPIYTLPIIFGGQQGVGGKWPAALGHCPNDWPKGN